MVFSTEKCLAWAFEYHVTHNIAFGPPIQSVSGLVFQVIFLPCELYGAAFCEPERPKRLKHCDV